MNPILGATVGIKSFLFVVFAWPPRMGRALRRDWIDGYSRHQGVTFMSPPTFDGVLPVDGMGALEYLNRPPLGEVRWRPGRRR